VSTSSVLNPDLTERVAIKAKTDKEMPIRLIQVIVVTPPSERFDRR